jgi:hypothetical protein
VRSDAWQIEANYVPGTLEEAVELHDRVIAAGNSRAVAAGLVMWVASKSDDRDQVANGQRTRYRKVLADLERSGYPGPSSRVRLDIPG